MTVDVAVLTCYVVWNRRYTQFSRSILPSFSGLKSGLRFSETMASTETSTRCHNAEQYRRLHRSQKLSSHSGHLKNIESARYLGSMAYMPEDKAS
jgi:hypothetical protein